MPSKSKILAFSTAYYPLIGGAEIALREIVSRLSDRFDFIIITSRLQKNLSKRERVPEGEIIRLGFGYSWDKWLLPFWSLFFGWKFLVANGFRTKGIIFWGMDISQGSVAALLWKFLCPQIPFVFTIQYGESPERLERGRFGLLKIFFKQMLKKADYVTVISSYLLKLAKKYGYKGSAEVIPNGVDLEKFKIKNEKPKDADKKIIITTSRLVPKNGIDTLISAVEKVKNTYPDIQCWILGDGPEMDSYKLLVKSCKLENNIKFFGNIPHKDIPKYLVQADIFVRPSRSEGMGNSFIEAMASGLPIIGTKVGGIPDIIKNGKTGLFVEVNNPDDLAEKIKELLDNEELVKELVENGQRLIEEKFEWKKISQAFQDIFVAQAKKAVRVLIATGIFPPDIGGPATYSKLLLEKLPRFGFKIEVLSFGLVRKFPKILRHLIYFLRVVQKGYGKDIIFAQDPVSVGLPSALAALVLGKKFVLKIVGDYAWEQFQQKSEVRDSRSAISQKFITLEEFQGGKFDLTTELRKKGERWAARRAKKIITPSYYLKKMVSQWGVEENKIEVIYNAYSMPKTDFSKAEAREKIKMRGKLLISAGRLVPWKGFDVLVKIMPDLLARIPDLRLIILGSGPDKDKILIEIEKLNLAEKVFLKGSVSTEEVLLYLKAGDIFVLNTAYEGLSHVVLEAMAMEIPIVTTKVGGNPEAIEDQKNGLLIDYNDQEALKRSIMELIENANLKEFLVRNAFGDLGKFKEEIMLGKTADFLRKI